MDDFIRPNKPTENKPKTKHTKELLICGLIVICLVIGFLAGYYTSKPSDTTVTTKDSNSVNEEAYQILKDHWVNTTGKDVDITKSSITGMLDSLGDIHSTYFTSEEAIEYNESVNGNFQGIGVAYSEVSNGAMITKVYDKSPASKAGLKVGDILNSVDGTDLSGKDAEEIKKLVRGDAGSVAKFKVIRGSETKEIEVTRGEVNTDVVYQVRDNNGHKFGYVCISTFGTTTAKEVETALKDFKEQGIEDLVIDLRDNGGGYVNAAVDFLDLFVKSDQVIYKMQEKTGPEKVTKAASDNCYTFTNGYVLVNGNTASASELTAGTLQQVLKYKLIGSQTYGKGTAQTQQTLSDGSVLKYTYAKWMLPDGTCVDGKGLTPDIKVDNPSTKGISTKSVKGSLQVDCVNTRVKSMQKMLKLLGYNVDRTDGYFSNQTSNILKEFETKYKLEVNGTYEESDRQRLLSELMIYIYDESHDNQYKKLLEIIK